MAIMLDGGKSRCCAVCGKLLGRNKICCSRKCYAQYRQHYRECPICGKSFPCSPSSQKICCSKECSHKYRLRIIGGGIYDDSIVRAYTAAKRSPICQPDANHHGAKGWVLRAPDGTIYECRNLLNFLREHADIIDGTPLQAWNGISKIKYGLQGKRKRPAYQWKGWRLLSWE